MGVSKLGVRKTIMESISTASTRTEGTATSRLLRSAALKLSHEQLDVRSAVHFSDELDCSDNPTDTGEGVMSPLSPLSPSSPEALDIEPAFDVQQRNPSPRPNARVAPRVNGADGDVTANPRGSADYRHRPMASWTHNEVLRWLSRIGLDPYVERFRIGSITGTQLAGMHEVDHAVLRTLIKPLGHRKLLLDKKRRHEARLVRIASLDG